MLCISKRFSFVIEYTIEEMQDFGIRKKFGGTPPPPLILLPSYLLDKRRYQLARKPAQTSNDRILDL